MANVADEAKLIREILDVQLTAIATALGAGGGGEGAELTEQQLRDLLAALAAPALGVPGGIDAGTNGEQGPGLIGRGSSYGVRAIGAGATGRALDLYSDGPDLIIGQMQYQAANQKKSVLNVNISPPFEQNAAAGFGAAIGITAQLTPSTYGALLYIDVELSGNPLSATITFSAHNGSGSVPIMRLVAAGLGATESGLELFINGAWARVKVGAAGSGPAGSGRALYVD